MKEVVVIGSGGQAANVFGILAAMGAVVHSVYDDDEDKWGGKIMGAPVQGPVEDVRHSSITTAVIAIGDGRVRRDLARKLDLDWINVVHPKAVIDDTVVLGSGCVIDACAVIHPGAVLGDHVNVLSQTSLGHGCRLSDYSFVGHGCIVAGSSSIGEGVMLGIGSLVLPGRKIDDWAVVGAGAVVTRDVSAGAVAVSEALAARERPS